MCASGSRSQSPSPRRANAHGSRDSHPSGNTKEKRASEPLQRKLRIGLAVHPFDFLDASLAPLARVRTIRAVNWNGARPTIMMKPQAAATIEAMGRATSGLK